MNYSSVVVAAGVGSRTGLNYNKVFFKLGDKTIIEKSIENFDNDKDCKEIILVISKNEERDFESLGLSNKVKFVYGGKRRQDSVYNGLLEVSEEYVMIHDGARPYIDMKEIQQIKEELKTNNAVLVMVPSIDTSKIVVDGYVKETLDRTIVYNAQTPQAFKTSLIKDCYVKINENNLEATDDAQVVEMMSDEKIKVVVGSYENKKITVENDLFGGER